ncbi:MAG: hypothetical protein NUV82_02105 [Candidatus Komeilibacteria bacterium]|nr:hypothetical protein [Candidatus Komeilibacteria bacterium]
MTNLRTTECPWCNNSQEVSADESSHTCSECSKPFFSPKAVDYNNLPKEREFFMLEPDHFSPERVAKI